MSPNSRNRWNSWEGVRWRTLSWPLAALFSALLVPLPAGALSSDKDQPITIEADSVDYDEKTGKSIYRGDVVVQQGTIEIKADEVTVYRKEGETDRVIATGAPVRFKQRPDDSELYVKGRAQRVEYDANSDTVYLIDKARITQGNDSFDSDRIQYDRVNAVMKAGASAQGKQRVRITIDSDSNKKSGQ
jgi:lipopolysaccharide export system protein LptA